MRFLALVPVLTALLPSVQSLSSTDSPQDGDVSQSGYSPNHNFDPAKLSSYKSKWTYTTNFTSEFFYAKPLVYTPNGASYERIYIVSDMNVVRVLDGVTGHVLVNRTLEPPFRASDTQCGDIANQVGIIGTPIIDTATETMYFWSKSYRNGQVGPLGTPTPGADNSKTGVANGKWQLYAVRLSDLSDAPGFPISIEGLNAHNDPTRYIISGTLNQRPGLAMLGNTIITGFGSHCDNFNFTGYLITASKTPGVGITDIQAMVASPGAPSQALDLTKQNNGKSGIWQGGVGLAIDASKNQVFFAVGNGQSPGQLNGDNGVPTPGLGNYLSTLENAVANYNVDPNTGKLSQADWFVTTDYDHLNEEDKDIGSSGLTLLDPSVFSGGGVKRIAVAAGKIARIIIMNADNLGGFKMGPNKTDGVLQEIQLNPDNYAFFSGVASYPLEGGYIYFVPTSGHIMAYKFDIVNGAPFFTLAGQTDISISFAGRGAPRVTSLNGQAGTGIVWIADIDQGIQAFHAIPDANGILQPYNLVLTGRLNKFHRPQFGNGTVYSAELNSIIALGLPISGSSSPTPPVGSTSASSSSTLTSKSSTSIGSSSSATLSSSSPVSDSKTSSSSIHVSSSSSTHPLSSTASKPPPVSVSATSTSILTTGTSTTVLASSTGVFSHVGCYQDTSASHALPLLFANQSVTPELCEAYVRSLANQPTPTVYNYFYLEYHNECYGGNTFSFQGSAISSITGANACTDVCSGSMGAKSTGTAKCGGAKQFNLYVNGGRSNLPAGWPGVTVTSTSTSKVAPPTSFSVPVASTSAFSSASSMSSVPPSTSTSNTVQTSTNSAGTSPASSSTSKVLASSSTSSTPPPYVTPLPPAGKRVNLNWNLGWVNAAPDGFTRPVIGINGQWPCPPIVLNYGDTLVLSVYNGLGNESTAIHFHGLQQRNTTYADGPSWATQCPVPPGETIVYQFRAMQVGTYWYHAHHAGQYIDGLRGAFIVQNPSPPYGKVDQDITLTLTDFYHQEAPSLINYYQSAANYRATGGKEPLPDAALINEAQNVKFKMIPGQRNLFRVINMGAMAGQYLQFDGHNMTIVEVDGQYVQPYTVQQLFVAAAQRYAVIIESASDASTNYAIVASMDTKMFGDSGDPANSVVSGWLIYDTTKSLPAPFSLTPQPWNDLAMIPLDQLPLFDPPSQLIPIAADFNADSNLIPRALLNGNAYIAPKVPTLYTVLSAPPEYLLNSSIYGAVNPIFLPFGAIIELQITNHGDRAHPFHLHGHTFQVTYRGSDGSLFPGLESSTPPTTPLRRDTLVVYKDNTATIRFVADNPGIQLFHCHTEWHVIGGMTATFIEAPDELRKQGLYIPASHRTACDKQGIPRAGNAGGDAVDWGNFTGVPMVAPLSNWGALVKPPS